MNKKLKVLASALTVLMVASTLVGCGSSSSSSGTKSGQTLTIWSQYKDSDFAPVKKVAEDWAKKTGNTVKIVQDQGGFQSLKTAVKSSKGPDIELGVAQDNLGTFVAGGVVEEVPSTAKYNKSDYLTSAANATVYKGKTWGIPCLLKTNCLFYNTDLVSSAPKTWDELEESAKTKGLAVDPTNFYNMYAFIAANGGYAFKVKNGTPDTSDCGLGNDGAVKGYAMIKKLIDDKILTPSDTGDIPKGKFTTKKAAYFISGTWDVGALKSAGMNFKVATFPTINGKPVPTFASVDVNLVSKGSKNKDLAFQFLTDTSKDMQKALYDVNSSIPTLKSLADSKDVSGNDITKAFVEQSKAAEVMGNYPEFSTIWDPGANNLKLLVAGKQTPEQTAANVKAQVAQAVAGLK